MRSRSACGADMALACHQVRLSRGTWTKSPSDEVGAVRAGWHGETPLWYFVLREADVRCDGNRLGPVGARIVGEVLVGLLDLDQTSVRHAPKDWQQAFSLVELPGCRARAETWLAATGPAFRWQSTCLPRNWGPRTDVASGRR